MADQPDDIMVARLASGVGDFDPAAWDRCGANGNPFVSHAFLSILERSGSATAEAGWQPLPIAIDAAGGDLAGVTPAYVKSHSQGEYIFDHGWADAWHRAGGHYYPKLLIAAPFTPVPGPRLLTRDEGVARGLIAAAEAIVARHGLSSAHANFLEPRDIERFRAAGWLIREGSQFHWANAGYAGFDDFLASLSSRKRKAIRKERASAVAGLEIVQLTGAAIGDAHWDAFWEFYQDTGTRKWGRPYLTRSFFSLFGEEMADRVLLVFALRDGQPIAGALNLIGADALYGRNWGCIENHPFLHFEVCYHQAIDFAIERNLRVVEAGAQGEHKLARGYMPVTMHSAHYIRHPGLRKAIEDYLKRERREVARMGEYLEEHGPFRKTE